MTMNMYSVSVHGMYFPTFTPGPCPLPVVQPRVKGSGIAFFLPSALSIRPDPSSAN